MTSGTPSPGTPSPETPNTEVTAIQPVSPQTDAIVESEMADESDELKRETKKLVEAIRKRAQAEIQGAEKVTREAYLNAVQQARETIEQNKVIDPEKIERSIELTRKDVEKNWQAIADEITQFGDRLREAAETAWEDAWRILTAPETDDDESGPNQGK